MKILIGTRFNCKKIVICKNTITGQKFKTYGIIMSKNKKRCYQPKIMNCELKKVFIQKKCLNGGADVTVTKICGNMESGPNIQLLQRANSYRNIKKRKLIWLDVKSGRPKCL